MVDNDPQALRLLAPNTSFFKLKESESATLADLRVIAHGGGTHSRSEEGERTNSKSGSFRYTSITTAKFTPWLIKPCADAALPVFSEVISVEN